MVLQFWLVNAVLEVGVLNIAFVGRFFGSFNIIFDQITCRFLVVQDLNSVRDLKWTYHGIIAWGLLSFTTVIKFFRAGDIEKQTITLFFWLTALTLVAAFNILRWLPDDFCHISNLTFSMLTSIKVHYIRNQNQFKVNRRLCLILLLLHTGGLSCAFLTVLLAVVFPRGNIFLSELVPAEYYSFFPVGLLITLIHIKLLPALYFNVALAATLLVVYMYYLTVLTGELTCNKPIHNTTEGFRFYRNIMKTYRCLQILHVNLMAIAGHILVFLHIMMVVIPIYASYITITHWHSLSEVAKAVIITIGVACFNFWAVVLQLGKILDVRGRKMIDSWKRHNWRTKQETREMSKFSRSCQLILLRHENMLIVRKITHFIYVKGVVKGTFRSLLTLAAT